MPDGPRDPLSLPAVLDALAVDVDRPEAPPDPLLALRRLGALLGHPAEIPTEGRQS